MLVAADKSGTPIMASVARRGEPYICPACGGGVVYRQGRWVAPHFAHRPAEPCPYRSEPESAAHLAMKAWVFERFRVEPWVRRCELERVIGDFRTDVWLETDIGPVAIECQVSSVTIAELKEKLLAYTAAKVATLYLIHHSVLPTLAEGAELRVPSWVLALHALFRGRLYFDEGCGELVPIHLAPVLREDMWMESSRPKLLKTMRRLRRGSAIRFFAPRCSSTFCKHGALAGGTFSVSTFDAPLFWR